MSPEKGKEEYGERFQKDDSWNWNSNCVRLILG